MDQFDELAQAGETISGVADQLPPFNIMVLLVVAGLGLILWLLGRKLLTGAVMLCGLVVGGAGGYIAGALVDDGPAITLGLLVIGAILGVILSKVLFRPWIAMVGALLGATLAPAGFLIWQGTPPPGTFENEVVELADGMTPLTLVTEVDTVVDSVESFEVGEAENEGGELTRNEVLVMLEDWIEWARITFEDDVQSVRSWWEALPTSQRSGVFIFGAVAGLAGLLLGLIAPKTSAAVQTAVVGSVMMVLPARTLLLHFVEDVPTWLPTEPRGILVVIGLITVLGVVLQWSMFGKKADSD